MRTSKTLALISYNTPQFLKSCLEAHVADGIVKDYWFVQHEPDKDAKKAHIHAYVLFAKAVDTEAFFLTFNEYEPGSDKPLGVVCRDNQTGGLAYVKSLGDAYNYSEHNSQYLSLKEMDRNVLDYSRDDMTYSSQEFRETLEIAAQEVMDKLLRGNKNAQIGQALENGFTPYQVMMAGYRAFDVMSIHRALVYDREQKKLDEISAYEAKKALLKDEIEKLEQKKKDLGTLEQLGWK